MSRAWTTSGSVGRLCGSIVASALSATLVEESREINKRRATILSPGQVKPKDSASKEAHANFSSRCSLIYHKLLNDIDNHALQHDMRFSAQDDDWGQCWVKRTGIPLNDFAAIYEALEDYVYCYGDETWRNRAPGDVSFDPEKFEKDRALYDALHGKKPTEKTGSSSRSSADESLKRNFNGAFASVNSAASNQMFVECEQAFPKSLTESFEMCHPGNTFVATLDCHQGRSRQASRRPSHSDRAYHAKPA